VGHSVAISVTVSLRVVTFGTLKYRAKWRRNGKVVIRPVKIWDWPRGICSLFFTLNLRAHEDDKPKDAEGCQDSPLITRFPWKHHPLLGTATSTNNWTFRSAMIKTATL